jgi:dTDP-4-amino-4,6-dideoxygalactose transaminase
MSRAQFIDALKDRNIGASVHFIPIHLHPYYQNRFHWQEGQYPVAERFFQQEVSLPLYPSMSEQDIDDVIQTVRDILLSHQK